jgi:3-oxoacyl-[acyl-carrier protein] reductase
MFSLEGKKTLITGATGGIGQEIAQILHQQGAMMTVSGTKIEGLETIKNNLGERVFIKPCNLKDLEEVKKLVEDAAELMSGIDILVCNAGITRDSLIMRMKDEDFEEVIKVNLTSTFMLNRAAVKMMIKNRWGRIINISSVVGVAGNPGQANYCASKAGVIGMSKSVAQECATRGVTVNCVAPGFIETPMTDVLNEEQKNRILSGIPMAKMGKSRDVANAVAFLATEEANYITGQTIHVNGGMLMV